MIVTKRGGGGGGSTPLPAVEKFDASCTINEEPLDFVYLESNGSVRRTESLYMNKSDAVGIILLKYDGTNCSVQTDGYIIKSGIVKGKKYYLDPNNPGKIIDHIPSAPCVVKPVGFGVGSNTLMIKIDQGFSIK